MKYIKYFLTVIIAIVFFIACQDKYIDDISAVDPGPDEAPPSVAIDFPLSSTQIRVLEDVASVDIRFQVTDDIEVETIVLNIDGTDVATFNEFIDFRNVSEEYTYDELTNGSHTITITATDADGKTGTASVDFEKTEPYEPMDGEVLYIPFDGEVVDLITLESGSTTNSGISYVDGVTSSAISFDASLSAYALFSPSDEVKNVESFTISYWMHPDFVDTDDSGTIDGVLGMVNLSNTGRFWGNIDLFIENGSSPDNARMRLHFTNTDITGATQETWIADADVEGLTNIFNTWSHQVITFDADASEFNYYVNGVLIKTATSSWSGEVSFENSGPMSFGCVQFMTTPSLTEATGAQGWASYLTGELDELRIFDKP